ncbi:PepSY domain-containing protein [Cellvibrio sp.]|uniref:PepSY domain-containing protein n=1 Tax=Cellvibrio sp. TaxID=1965322 RepID=UPI003964888C
MKKPLYRSFIHLTVGMSMFACAQTYAHADMECTDKPKSQWLHVLDMQKKVVNEYGFAIKKFQESGTCYEIYGWGLSKDGKKFEEIEVYFNPVTGEIVKKKFRD